MEWLIQGQKTISPSQKFCATDPIFHISKEPRNEHCHASITDCKARGSASISLVSIYSLFLTTLWRFALAGCVCLWIFYSVLWFTLTFLYPYHTVWSLWLCSTIWSHLLWCLWHQFFLLRIAFTIWGHLCFHKNFRIDFSNSVMSVIEMLTMVV